VLIVKLTRIVAYFYSGVIKRMLSLAYYNGNQQQQQYQQPPNYP